MNLPAFISLVASSAFSALASVLIKKAATPGHDGRARLLVYILAVVAYGFGFICYSISLRKLALHVAYPVMVAVTMLFLLAYTTVSNGAPSLSNITGSVLIALGIFLLLGK
jgi:small multidrug resistance pump